MFSRISSGSVQIWDSSHEDKHFINGGTFLFPFLSIRKINMMNPFPYRWVFRSFFAFLFGLKLLPLQYKHNEPRCFSLHTEVSYRFNLHRKSSSFHPRRYRKRMPAPNCTPSHILNDGKDIDEEYEEILIAETADIFGDEVWTFTAAQFLTIKSNLWSYIIKF